MRIYLDLCVYNRPFDYQGQDRIALETGIFIFLLEQIESGKYGLVTSGALVYENNLNTDSLRKDRINSYFRLAEELVEISGSDIKRAIMIRNIGFSDIDALHIALAEKSKADYFITCDDDIIKSYNKNREAINVHIISLTEFIGLEVK